MKRLLGSALALATTIAVACGDDPSEPMRRPSPCKAPPLPSGASIALEPAFGGVKLAQPVELVPGPGDRYYALEQAGLVKVLSASGAPTTAYDVTKRVTGDGEAGLLGIAFDPKFTENGFVYLYFTANYTTPKPGFVLQDTLVRVQSKDGGLTFDPTTEKVLLALDDPFPNGNGGHIAFGPDGFLYVGLGDGGGPNGMGGDPNNWAQNKDVLFGKILRIDPSKGDPYAIPSGNPFANGGGKPEIWAYGLRNPWKFSFDTKTGDLWCGDVGERRGEEIDRIVPGGNYGWSVREGRGCFKDPSCPDAGFIDPTVEYPRSQGISIVSGFVYRGTKVPALTGKLLYGDFGNGTIWSADAGAVTGTVLLESGRQISSFAQSADGELYVVDYQGGISSIVAAPAAAPAPAGPTTLAATGCLDRASGIAYDVASPLYSDGAEKERTLFVGTGKSITVAPDGDFDVPPGSVAVKTFSFGGKKIETRLFARYDDGTWAGWSYEWNDDQKDAVLLDGGKSKPIADGGTWTFPSRSECLQCHTQAAGFTLGLEARQLHASIRNFGPYLSAPIDLTAHPSLVGLLQKGPTAEQRARSYLHANCAGCHREGGSAGRATMDLRIDRPLAAMNICNLAGQAGDLGIADAKLFAPRAPERSLILARMAATDDARMPPIGRSRVDSVALAFVVQWISETSCP